MPHFFFLSFFDLKNKKLKMFTLRLKATINMSLSCIHNFQLEIMIIQQKLYQKRGIYFWGLINYCFTDNSHSLSAPNPDFSYSHKVTRLSLIMSCICMLKCYSVVL